MSAVLVGWSVTISVLLVFGDSVAVYIEVVEAPCRLDIVCNMLKVRISSFLMIF